MEPAPKAGAAARILYMPASILCTALRQKTAHRALQDIVLLSTWLNWSLNLSLTDLPLFLNRSELFSAVPLSMEPACAIGGNFHPAMVAFNLIIGRAGLVRMLFCRCRLHL